jgi:hypothetical protein
LKELRNAQTNEKAETQEQEQEQRREPAAPGDAGAETKREEVDEECEVLLQPQQGMGVLFNGRLSHAGKRVTRGLRHVYVASFDLRYQI